MKLSVSTNGLTVSKSCSNVKFERGFRGYLTNHFQILNFHKYVIRQSKKLAEGCDQVKTNMTNAKADLSQTEATLNIDLEIRYSERQTKDDKLEIMAATNAYFYYRLFWGF